MKIIGVSFRLPLRPVIVTIRIVLGSFDIPMKPLLQGGGVLLQYHLGLAASHLLFFLGVLACLDT